MVCAQAKKKSKIYDAQTDLEKVQRQEEDVLMEVFMAERTQEKKKIDKEIDDEWEERLRELTANFDADRDKRGGGHKGKDDDKKVCVAFLSPSKHFVVCRRATWQPMFSVFCHFSRRLVSSHVLFRPGLAISALVCFDFDSHILSSVIYFAWFHLCLAFAHVQTI